MAKSNKNRVPRPIAKAIGAMRRAVMRFFLVDGLNRALLCLFGFIAVSFTLDRLFRMDLPQRAIMLCLGIAAVLYVLWRFLVKPLMSRLSDDALLLQVEKSEGGMDERLISALELSRMEIGEDENVSRGMVTETIERGAQAGREVDIARVFRLGKMRFNTAVFGLLALVLVAGAASLTFFTPAKTWFNRNVMLGDAQWPQDYFLDLPGLEDGKLRVPRGDDWAFVAKVRDGYSSLPEEVELEVRTGAGKRTESMVPDADGTEFAGEFRNVLEPFDFRLTSKEAETEWFRVELVDRPKLDGLKLVAEAPDYTGAGSSELPVGAGPYYLLGGTVLKVSGGSDKALSAARLLIGEDRYELAVDGQTFSGSIDAGALKAGTYFLEIEDQEKMAIPGRDGLVGLGPREPARFKIRLKADKKPRVDVALEGVSGMVVPGARLPFEGRVTDDFAVEKVELAYEWKQDNSEDEPTAGVIDIGEILGEVGGAEVVIGGGVELGPLDIPVNTRLSLNFKADDNDTVTGPKTGESNKLLLRVVGEAELRTDLLRREKEQRQILAELVKKQDLLLTDTEALAAECRSADALDPSQRERLVDLQKSQKLTGSNLKPIVSRLAGMVQEILNNRLEEEDGILKARLNEKVIGPLRSVQELTVAEAALALEAARRETDAEERDVAFADAANAQRAAIASMREILNHMVRNEGYQQAVNLLYEIQRAQERMKQMTAKEKEKALGEVVEDKDKEGEGGRRSSGRTRRR